MRIFEILDSRLISFLDADTRDEAIDALDTILTEQGPAPAGEQAHHTKGGTHIG